MKSNKNFTQPLLFFEILVTVDCEWGRWKGSKCSVTCGTGKKELVRRIRRVAKNGGKVCSGQRRKYEDCTMAPCPGKTIFIYLLI